MLSDKNNTEFISYIEVEVQRIIAHPAANFDLSLSGRGEFRLYHLGSYKITYLSADDIATELSSLGSSSSKVFDTTAGRVFLERLEENIISKKDLIIESTLSGVTFERHLTRAKDLGYQIDLIYIFLDSPDVCNKRIQQRVLDGGHFIPPERVAKRFYKSFSRFWETYRKLASRWELHYNNSIDVPPRFISVAVGIGDIEIVEIAPELFQKFLGLGSKNE